MLHNCSYKRPLIICNNYCVFEGKNGSTNAPQCYVILALSVLYVITYKDDGKYSNSAISAVAGEMPNI